MLTANRTLWIVAALSGCFAMSAAAHIPHDQIPAMALSSNFSQDSTVFLGQKSGINSRTTDPLRSVDGGLSWTQTPVGMDNIEDFTSISVSPDYAQDQTLVYTTEGEGLFLSTDGGASWSRASGDLSDLDLSGSAVAADGLGQLVLSVHSKDQHLYLSQDLGVTWTESVIPGGGVRSYAFSPDFATDATIIAGHAGGRLSRSTDGGESWNILAQLPGEAVVEVVVLVPGYSTSGEIFVGTRAAGLYRSVDFGVNFDPVGLDLPDEMILDMAASPAYDSDRTLFLTTQEQGVFKSLDGGDSWALHDVGVELGVQSLVHFYNLAVSDGFATDGVVFLGAWEGLFKSSDGGETWKRIDTRPPTLVTRFAVSPDLAEDHAVIVTSYGGGNYASRDRGDSWQVANTGITNGETYDVAFARDEFDAPVAYAIQPGKVLESRDYGGRWRQLRIAPQVPKTIWPTTLALSPRFSVNHLLLLGTREDGMLATAVGLDLWRRPIGPLGVNIFSIAFSPAFETDGTLFAATNTNRVFRSTDGGMSWQDIGGQLPEVKGALWLVVSPEFAADRVVLAGTPAGLYSSTDSGDSWEPLGVGSPLSTGPVEGVALSPDFGTDRTIVASIRGFGLFRSTDAGSTWEELQPSLLESGQQMMVLRFSPEFTTDSTLFAAARTDLFRSTDGGDTWTDISIGSVRHEESRPTIVRAGSWQSLKWEEASTGRLVIGSGVGSEASFSFFGTGAAWIASRGPNLGTAEVYLDGDLVATVDQFSPSLVAQEALFHTGPLPLDSHVLSVISIDGPINLDAFDFDR